MTDPQTVETSPVPDQAPPADGPRLARANLPNLLATQLMYTHPAVQQLEQAFQAHAAQHPQSNPIAEVVHYDVIAAWCEANPGLAARIVLASVYLANGGFVVQMSSEGQPAPDASDPAPEPEAPPAPEAAATS